MTKRRAKDDAASLAKRGRRSRDVVLRDFEKISGPLRGQNRDPKPKA